MEVKQQQHEADHEDQVGQRHPRDIAEPVIRQALDDERVEADRRREAHAEQINRGLMLRDAGVARPHTYLPSRKSAGHVTMPGTSVINIPKPHMMRKNGSTFHAT